MKKLTFKANQKQADALHGIFYWVHESYLSNMEGDTQDCERCRETLKSCFSEADAVGVPFWVQNTVIMAAQKRETEYFNSVLAAMEG